MGTFKVTSAYDSAYADLSEWIPDCIFPSSMTTYSHMRHDPKLTAIYKALSLPIRRAPWFIDGTGCRPDVVELCSSALGVPIAGQDRPISGGVKWADVLRLACLHMVFGFMPFAKQYEITDDGVARLVRLQERMPITVTYIGVDENGELDYIDQSRLLTTSEDVSIDAKNLLWFAHEREGAAWHGQSVLRPAYAPWLIKHEMQRVLATSSRRFGMGVPVVDAPQGAGAGQVSQAQQLASAARVGDLAGVGMPAGFRFHLEGLTGTVPDTLGFLRYLDEQMSTLALAGWLDMPSTTHGSRALGETFVDLFMLSLQSEGTYLSETFTTDLFGEVVDLNYGPDEPVPTLVCGDVGSRQEITAQALQLLLSSGALSADPALEEYVRSTWSLPQRDPSAPWTPPPAPDPGQGSQPPPVTASRRPFVAAGTTAGGSSSGLRRAPTQIELESKVDFPLLQAQWVSELDKLVAAWDKDIKPKALDIVMDAIGDAVDSGDSTLLLQLTHEVPGAVELIHKHLKEFANNAADDAAEEAAEQDVEVDAGEPNEEKLLAISTSTAVLTAAATQNAAIKRFLQVWTPLATGAELDEGIREYVGGLVGEYGRELLGGSLSGAGNEGRAATFRNAPEATYFASEILDKNTCPPCQQEDGHRFDSLDDAEAAYATGGFINCDGGLRCRGVIVAVWGDVPDDPADAVAKVGFVPSTPDTQQSIIDRVKAQGGMTVDAVSGEEPTTGYAVAQRGKDQIISAEQFFAADGAQHLADYIKANKTELTGGQYLGLWHDTDHGEVVLDVVDVIKDRDKAIAAGIANNQQAIFDIDAGDTIDTGGTGDRPDG